MGKNKSKTNVSRGGGGGSDFDNLKSPLAALGVFVAAVLLVAFIPTILSIWRSIVGTMMETLHGRFTKTEFSEIFKSGDRTQAGTAAPARGLFLESVSYD